MRSWKPLPGVGLWVALALLGATLAGCVLLVLRLAPVIAQPPQAWPVNLGMFGEVLLLLILLVLSGALIYRTLAAITLTYELDRNGLYIRWLGNRAVVPISQIETVDAGAVVTRTPLGPIQRIGYFWGQGATANGKTAHQFSTRAPNQSLAVHTADAVYLVSPRESDAFIQELEQRRGLGSTQALTSTVQSSRMFLYAFWNDKTVRLLLGLALLINLALLAVLSARYPGLPDLVQMRFSATGAVAELRPRHQALFLPLAGFGLVLLNTAVGLILYSTQQVGVRLLQGASVVVQVLFAVAVLTIIR